MTASPRAPDLRRRPRGLAILIILLVIAAGASLAIKLTGNDTRRCESSFVPAFFEPSVWSQIPASGSRPAVIILNPASGPGDAPDPALRSQVSQAREAGTRVLGYIGTEYGERSPAQAQRWIHDYRAWYHVSGVFLDQIPTEGRQQLGYYQGLTGFARQVIPGATIWLNPGDYPDRAYMSIGGVVMAFEGPYDSYLRLKVPDWARQYPAARFAHTIYATPERDLDSAVSMSRQRNAGYLFVTNLGGPNPYGALPDYWGREVSAVPGCGGS